MVVANGALEIGCTSTAKGNQGENMKMNETAYTTEIAKQYYGYLEKTPPGYMPERPYFVGDLWNSHQGIRECLRGRGKNEEYYDSDWSIPSELKKDEQHDAVNHPSHYNVHAMECIDEMVVAFGKQKTIDFCILNAWKYRYRSGHKGFEAEVDLKKSDWYLQKAKELQE